MECKNLYRVQEKDLDRLREILTICFKNDPLYSALIEDQETRERLMPHLFSCDVTECFETCEVYADSEELKGILVTDGWLIHEDPSTRTFWNFMLGKDYLNSAWTAQLHQTRRLHVIYLAVDPAYQHHGLAEMMMQEVIDQAEEHGMMISLETHNPKNVAFYEHLGFKTFGVVEKAPFHLKQYCMIRELGSEKPNSL